ncbi:MAG: hypothetical protein AAF533_04530 [Acidobacteriota bacterium]
MISRCACGLLVLVLALSVYASGASEIRLLNPCGEVVEEFQPLDSVLLEVEGLDGRSAFDVIIERDDETLVSRQRLSSDERGTISTTAVLYGIGARPCEEAGRARPPEESSREGVQPAPDLDDVTDRSWLGRSYTLRVEQDGRPVHSVEFDVASRVSRPMLRATDASGCHKTGFLIDEEGAWVTGRGFPAGSFVRLWVVEERSDWTEDVELVDVSGQFLDEPPLLELAEDQTTFHHLIWPAELARPGAHDIVAEILLPDDRGRLRLIERVIAYKSFTGLVWQYSQFQQQALEMEIAGTVNSPLTYKSTFLPDENVFVGVDPAIQPSFIGQTADIYIVDHKTQAQWMIDDTLTDVTGNVETVTIHFVCGNCWKTLAWPANLTQGEYDVVMDFDQDGKYTNGTDLIDSLNAVGFTVADIRVESVEFNYSGAGAIDIWDDDNTADIFAPEYVAGSDVQAAAWTMGGSHSVRVNFEALSGVNSAEIWSTGGLGGLASSSSPVMVNFSGGTGQAVFNVNSPPSTVGKWTYDWYWKFKDVNGVPSSTLTMGQTEDHLLYTVLTTPNAPQVKPWLNVLDIACTQAHGKSTASDVTYEIWHEFYYNAGGNYDTSYGAPSYGGGGSFNLTNWIANYKGTAVATCNCYDMGKSVAVFANALGAGAVYSYTSPFGFLNAIRPIGSAIWVNNPFYNNFSFSSTPLMPGDSSSDANGNRSSFANHAFTRVGVLIFDASGGRVDIDSDPDDPPHVAQELAGSDSWTSNYRDEVIDFVPSSNPGTPTDITVTVY